MNAEQSDRQCTAHSKRTKERCKKFAMKGRNVCMFHGGKSRRSIAHPAYEHGRYDGSVPKALRGDYERSFNDPELLNLRADISLIDARIQELLANTESGIAATVLVQARKHNEDMRKATLDEKYGLLIEASYKLDIILSDGIANFAAWDQVTALIEQRRKLVESEQKRIVAMKAMLTEEQAMALITALQAVIKRNVNDPTALTNISRELAALLS